MITLKQEFEALGETSLTYECFLEQKCEEEKAKVKELCTILDHINYQFLDRFMNKLHTITEADKESVLVELEKWAKKY